MAYLSEGGTVAAGGFLLLAGAFLVALKVTQQSKHLVRAGAALGLAVVVVIVDWLWVTDTERIEQVVYDLRRAVLNSDVEGVLVHLAPNVQYVQGGAVLSAEATRSLIRNNLSDSHFDLIRISELQVSVAQQARRGKAEFHVLAKGVLNTTLGTAGGGTSRSSWSLGFQETEPGVWKVNRITPLSIPGEALILPGGSPLPDGPGLGLRGRSRMR
jgi:hypothetical protein